MPLMDMAPYPEEQTFILRKYLTYMIFLLLECCFLENNPLNMYYKVIFEEICHLKLLLGGKNRFIRSL